MAIGLVLAGLALAAVPTYVSRAEFKALKKRVSALEQDMAQHAEVIVASTKRCDIRYDAALKMSKISCEGNRKVDKIIMTEMEAQQAQLNKLWYIVRVLSPAPMRRAVEGLLKAQRSSKKSPTPAQ